MAEPTPLLVIGIVVGQLAGPPNDRARRRRGEREALTLLTSFTLASHHKTFDALPTGVDGPRRDARRAVWVVGDGRRRQCGVIR
jgi:hypothetical protein